MTKNISTQTKFMSYQEFLQLNDEERLRQRELFAFNKARYLIGGLSNNDFIKHIIWDIDSEKYRRLSLKECINIMLAELSNLVGKRGKKILNNLRFEFEDIESRYPYLHCEYWLEN